MSGEQRNVCGLCITVPDLAQKFKLEDEVPSLPLHCSKSSLISVFLTPQVEQLLGRMFVERVSSTVRC